MPDRPALNIDLSRDTLRLNACGICFALTLKHDQLAHAEWHERTETHGDA